MGVLLGADRLLYVLLCSCHSNEREFLRDLVTARPGTSGARLASWLQPEPRLEPALTETACGGEPLRCGWPAGVTVTTRDQHGVTAYTAGLQVRTGSGSRSPALTHYWGTVWQQCPC